MGVVELRRNEDAVGVQRSEASGILQKVKLVTVSHKRVPVGCEGQTYVILCT